MSIFNREKLNNSYRRYILVALTIVSIVAIIGVISKISNNVNGDGAVVPDEFIEARTNAGEIAEEITDLTRASSRNINTIGDAERAGDFQYGLELVTEEINRNARIRQDAVDLSEELKVMSINLSAVHPSRASDIGYQAVTTGLELVQHLVNYNNYTYELLDVIQARLEGSGESNAEDKIKELILNINTEAELVNEINEEYKSLSSKFDSLTIPEGE